MKEVKAPGESSLLLEKHEQETEIHIKPLGLVFKRRVVKECIPDGRSMQKLSDGGQLDGNSDDLNENVCVDGASLGVSGF